MHCSSSHSNCSKSSGNSSNSECIKSNSIISSKSYSDSSKSIASAIAIAATSTSSRVSTCNSTRIGGRTLKVGRTCCMQSVSLADLAVSQLFRRMVETATSWKLFFKAAVAPSIK